VRRLAYALPLLLLFVVASTRFTGPAASPADREVARIRMHFDSVLAELEGARVNGLTPVQRERRTALVETLQDYRARGVFPHNRDFPGQAVPYFIDRRTGTLCAVAHLLASTGRRDIVERVARMDNNVRVASLAADTAFTAWLGANGITLDEAARIQVPYLVVEPSPAQQRRNSVFAVASPVAAAGSIVSSMLNLRMNADGHSRATSLVGVVSGVATASLGLMSINKPGVPMAASVAGIGIGGLGLALSGRSIQHHALAVREAERATTVSTASVTPFVSTRGDGAGVSVSLRF
jgi:hypothetical protein